MQAIAAILARMKHREHLLGFALALLMLAVLALDEQPRGQLLSSSRQGHGYPIAAGMLAPDFALPRRSGGGTLSLKALEGRLFVIAFVSAGCPYTTELRGHLIRRRMSVLDRALVVVEGDSTRSADRTDQADSVFYSRFNVLVDTTGRAFQDYGIVGTPTAYLVDGEGRVRESVQGTRETIDLLHRVDLLDSELRVTGHTE